jgi:GNAT superfamily N-acetyltransferase
MSYSIEQIGHDRIKEFIDFPHDLYNGDPNYVAEIYLAMKDHHNPKRNPYFKHSAVQYWIAKKDGKIAGRICASINNKYNEFHKSNVGFFGFFDAINDPEIAKALIDEAEKYCRAQGAARILGPANFTTNDTATMLVEGFDSPPVIQMAYNFPYYQKLVEDLGYQKEMDLFAYYIPTSTVNDKSMRLSNMLKERLKTKGITFRNIDKSKWKSEVEAIRENYKKAWENNWGFVPPTNEEFDFIAEGLKLVVDERFALVAEQEGKMIGFAVALPNINEIMINSKRGRLLPFHIFNLLFKKSKTKIVRVILLGVIESHRKLGIEGVFYGHLIEQAKKANMVAGEASWILENNQMMNQGARNLGGEPYKRYRIYSKNLL